MFSPAHGQIIVHGENHSCLFQQKLQVPGQCAFSRAGGSVEQDDAPASRPGRFPVLRRVFFSHGFMVFRTVRGGVPVTVSRPAGSGPFRKGGGFLAGEAGWFPEDVGRGGHGRFMGIMNKKLRQGNHKNGSVRTESLLPFMSCRADAGKDFLAERLWRHGCRSS